MDEEKISFELARLLKRDLWEGEALQEERMRRWTEAFDAWLAERETRFSPKVRRESYNAWKDFLAFTGKAPWETQTEDVEAYIETLQKKGASRGTIFKRLTGLKKFYEHCQKEGIDPECGAGFNPAAKALRPRAEGYGKANYLCQEEEAALLKAIRRDPSPTGKRDYALFLALLTTGRKAGEIRQLKWGAVGPGDGKAGEAVGAGVREKGDDAAPTGAREPEFGGAALRLQGQRVALPEAVWEAIRDYLEVSGRLAAIQPQEYVFAPGKAPLVREAGHQAEDWAGNRPLSLDEVHYLLKLYAGWAGLRVEAITCHTLRHTAAVRMAERGEAVEALQARLGRKGTSKTKGYLKRLAERPKARRRIRSRLKKGQVPERGPGRAQPRNHLALKHGLTAKYLPELETLVEQGVQLESPKWQILRWKVVMLRAMMLSKGLKDLDEMLHLAEAVGTAAGRIGKLKLALWKLEQAEEKTGWEEAAERFMGEMGEEEEGDGSF